MPLYNICVLTPEESPFKYALYQQIVAYDGHILYIVDSYYSDEEEAKKACSFKNFILTGHYSEVNI